LASHSIRMTKNYDDRPQPDLMTRDSYSPNKAWPVHSR